MGIGQKTSRKNIPINVSRIYLKHRFYETANSDNQGIGYNLDGKLYTWGKTKDWRIGQMPSQNDHIA